MSALGQKRTSRALAIYVRFRGNSGHSEVTVGGSPFECPLLGAKRTFWRIVTALRTSPPTIGTGAFTSDRAVVLQVNTAGSPNRGWFARLDSASGAGRLLYIEPNPRAAAIL